MQPERSIWRTYTFWTCNFVYEFNLESQAQSAPNTCVRHKRGHELSTRSSAVVQETMPNRSGSSGADVFFGSHMPKSTLFFIQSSQNFHFHSIRPTLQVPYFVNFSSLFICIIRIWMQINYHYECFANFNRTTNFNWTTNYISGYLKPKRKWLNSSCYD